MTRLLIWILAGLLLGLAVHATSLALVAKLAPGTSERLVEMQSSSERFAPLERPVDGAMTVDPALREAICRYDLSRGPVSVRVPLGPGFTSVALFTSGGRPFFALTNRSAAGREIAFTIYTAAQLAEARGRDGPDAPERLRVEAPDAVGAIIARALVPVPSEEDVAATALAEASCLSGSADRE